MSWSHAALLGGGACFFLEAWELYRAFKRCGGWPWKHPTEATKDAFILSVVVRVSLGAFFAASGAQSGQVTTVISAVTWGVSPPLVLEQVIGRRLPGPDSPRPAPAR
jgi:hypothetical protein